jgi:hypothetical protein
MKMTRKYAEKIAGIEQRQKAVALRPRKHSNRVREKVKTIFGEVVVPAVAALVVVWLLYAFAVWISA